ncbi:anaerobic ribonucleoside-triphosphate reductase activating protein [bacterium]|nr:anaerobic ribonucleoside-triphosphate reductase activating protein [bacterium]
MKIGGIQPFSLCDYPGKISAVVFVQGCNFRCPFCHNKALIPEKKKSPSAFNVEEVFRFLKERQGQLDGIVISGGEPCLQTGLASFIRTIRKMDYKVKLDTNGSFTDPLNHFIKNDLVDFIAMDVKAPLDKYNKLAGVTTNPAEIQKSMEIISASQLPHQFRTTWDKNLLTAEDIEEIRTIIPTSSEYVVQECNYH